MRTILHPQQTGRPTIYALELINISKSFGPVKANQDINLQIVSGDIHGIIGENGAGKSTLMSIMYGFYEADSGTIKVNSEQIRIRNSQQALAELMVGRKVRQEVDRRHNEAGHTRLQVNNLNIDDASGIRRVKNLSFQLAAGEIVGIAGVSGNGQGVVLPGVGVVPVQFIESIPYLLTVILLAGLIGKANPPKAAGVPYVKER